MTSNSYHIIHLDFILFRFLIIISMCHVFYEFQFISSTCMVYHIMFKQTYTYKMANRNISSHIKYIQGQIRRIPIHIRLILLSRPKPLIKSLFAITFHALGCPFNSFSYRFFKKISFSKVSRPESPTQPGWRIQAEARFTPTFSIKTFCFVLLNFYFQKCRDPNPRLDPVARSKLEPGLLRHFQLSFQNMLFMLFYFRPFN